MPLNSITSSRGAALITSYAILSLSACTTLQKEPDAQGVKFDFALIGDVPYDARHEREFANVMKDIDAAGLAFVIHDGDFWWDGAAWTEEDGGLPPCSDEAFVKSAGAFRRMFTFRHVVFP